MSDPTSNDRILSSNSSNVPETLRGIVRDGSAWVSAGIIGEAANLLDDVDALLGQLAECFGDEETEFADIKLMRDRIAAVDTRDRHEATTESTRRHSHETLPSRITVLNDGRAMGGSDVCHTCEAHCTVINDLQTALRGLYWDNVDYLTLNKLGGMQNHWMRAARMALGMDVDDVRPSQKAGEHLPDQLLDVHAICDQRDAFREKWQAARDLLERNTPMTDEQIKHMVNRFLGWRLPENFRPDAGISFKAEFNEHTAHPARHQPIGTNLFDAEQAEAMIRYMLEGIPNAQGKGVPHDR